MAGYPIQGASQATAELPKLPAPRLLACPFCTGEGRETKEADSDWPSKCFMFIQCTRCGARTANVYGSGDPSEWADARHNWNQRLEAGRASRAQSDWDTGTEDADGNPLVTVRSDALVALGEFALTPALTSIRVGDERLSRVELTSRLMDAVKCAAPATTGETK